MKHRAELTLVPQLLSGTADDDEIKSCFPVFHELRPHLRNEMSFCEQVRRQHRVSDYDISVIRLASTVVSAIGFRISEHLAWGKVLYIDDLSTLSNHRNLGCAASLLNWAADYGKAEACEAMHLDSGYGRKHAHRLYLKQGFELVSHHFSRHL